MSLSEFLRNYRAEHKLSMDDLAKRCGLSKPYISMLEKNRNSKNGKSITPSIRTYEKIAHGVGLTVDALMKLINGDERVALVDIALAPAASDLLPLTANEESLLSKYRRLDDRRQYAVQGYTDSKLEEQEREAGELYEEHIKEA